MELSKTLLFVLSFFALLVSAITLHSHLSRNDSKEKNIPEVKLVSINGETHLILFTENGEIEHWAECPCLNECPDDENTVSADLGVSGNLVRMNGLDMELM